MDFELTERQKSYREKRKLDLQTAVTEFRALLPRKKSRVLAYLKEESRLYYLDFLGITDATTEEEQFEKIFQIVPNQIREKVFREIYT